MVLCGQEIWAVPLFCDATFIYFSIFLTKYNSENEEFAAPKFEV
jgi:hypothetical protein